MNRLSRPNPIFIVPMVLAYHLMYFAASYCFVGLIAHLAAKTSSSKEKISKFPLIICLLILGIGSLGFFKYALSYYVRDLFYFANFFIVMLFGYYVVGPRVSIAQLLSLGLTAGIVQSVVHIGHFVVNPDALSWSGLEMRKYAGFDASLEVIGLLSLFVLCRLRVRIPFVRVMFVLLIVSFSIYLSRIGWVVLIGSLVVIFLSLKSRSLASIVLLGSSAAVVIVALVLIVASSVDSRQVDFIINKSLRSLSEISPRQYYKERLIHDNWRGYETYRTLQAFSSAPVEEKIAGRGFGYLIDLGYHIKLGGEKKLRFIPITHNAFVNILLKTGIVGLFIYLLFLCRIVKYSLQMISSEVVEDRFIGGLAMSAMLYLFVMTLVMNGMVSRSQEGAFIFWGAVLYLIQKSQIRPTIIKS